MDDRLITVAIHTYERALELKALLESEGVKASLQNVNLTQPVVASGVRVRIREKDLPLALRIIENTEIFINHKISNQVSERTSKILVPVDFTPHSLHALRAAFQIADVHKSEIVLLHSFVDPSVTATLQLSDTLDYDISATEMRESLLTDARQKMDRLAETLREEIKHAKLAPVKFTHEIVEGVPEEAIAEWAKNNNPLLIVMGTRGTDTKERQLVGSVTAEVLDTCCFPVFTLPENITLTDIHSLNRIIMFCSLDQEDLLALDELTRLIAPPDSMNITLVNIPVKRLRYDINAPMHALLSYCREHYPTFDFSACELHYRNVNQEFKKLITERNINLIAVPNRKKNIFARLFNPGIAHRILFQTDIPMVVLPV